MAFYSVTDMASDFAKARAALIETQLVRTIEELLDRVPTDQEVAHFGRRVISASEGWLEEFYWKDTFLFGVHTDYSIPKCHCYFDLPLIKRNTQ